ncbi:ThiF family adenylyltransferase [Acetobacterium malicum]|uniref:ThiF family adenylyltransferase n=1 Tax=Acetobacterium malicum TaxID=52692 RepID=UPI0035942816
MYNDTVLDHFANPRNVGSIPDADGLGISGNPVDGDKITIYIKVQQNVLTAVKFKTFGCGAAIAASSMLTVLATGKTLSEALKITNADVAEALGGLPEQKLLCSNIAADALYAAINDYTNKNTNLTDSKATAAILFETENAEPALSEKIEGLTDANQIKRYLRHIIMPDIGGRGQKKLLDTRMLVCAADAESCDLLLRYLTAIGIGHIHCHFESKAGWELALQTLNDLNPDVTFQFADDFVTDADLTIIIGNTDYATRTTGLLLNSSSPKISPTFISVNEAWQGCFGLCQNRNELTVFLNDIEKKGFSAQNDCNDKHFSDQLGLLLSSCFVGTLLAIEAVKSRLNIGVPLTDIFYFDLVNHSFDNHFSTSDQVFVEFGLSSYESEINNKLTDANILTIGAGGLGCPANLVLAKAGVNKLSLIDFDHVEISNLNRQILHSTATIGLLKVESAKQALEAMNPDLEVTTYSGAFSKENAREIIKKHDLVIDGLDNLPTRYLLNDVCYFEKKPLVEAGALAYYGQVTTLVPDEGPCFRCLFPETNNQTAGSCSETGVLGPVPGVMGVLEAIEAIKLIIGIPATLKGSLLMIDALETSFDRFTFRKDEDCPLCGKHPTIHELGDFTFVCETAHTNANE